MFNSCLLFVVLCFWTSFWLRFELLFREASAVVMMFWFSGSPQDTCISDLANLPAIDSYQSCSAIDLQGITCYILLVTEWHICCKFFELFMQEKCIDSCCHFWCLEVHIFLEASFSWIGTCCSRENASFQCTIHKLLSWQVHIIEGTWDSENLKLISKVLSHFRAAHRLDSSWQITFLD